MSTLSDPYSYVLYIDEAGDDGLRKVRPIDTNGSSEWLVIGGVLIESSSESEVVDWVQDIRRELGSTQGPALHFRNLSHAKRLQAGELLASRKVKLFVVASNKKNMRGYNNPRAAERGGTQWFYNYCVRILMERATHMCLAHSQKVYGEPRYLKVIFSKRGGHSYAQTKAYWELLKNQAWSNSTYLKRRQIAFQVLRFGLVEYVPHVQVAGLQLADIVASSFFQAVDPSLPRWSVDAAKALRPKMAKARGLIADYGLVLQPFPPSAAKLTVEQETIFREYGFEF